MSSLAAPGICNGVVSGYPPDRIASPGSGGSRRADQATGPRQWRHHRIAPRWSSRGGVRSGLLQDEHVAVRVAQDGLGGPWLPLRRAVELDARGVQPLPPAAFA
jgi:hypothetical protein